jgi:hypothetical protein
MANKRKFFEQDRQPLDSFNDGRSGYSVIFINATRLFS